MTARKPNKAKSPTPPGQLSLPCSPRQMGEALLPQVFPVLQQALLSGDVAQQKWACTLVLSRLLPQHKAHREGSALSRQTLGAGLEAFTPFLEADDTEDA